MSDPSCIFDLHHSSQQRQILNPLSRAGDQTQVLTDTSQIRYCQATVGTPCPLLFIRVTTDPILVLTILCLICCGQILSKPNFCTAAGVSCLNYNSDYVITLLQSFVTLFLLVGLSHWYAGWDYRCAEMLAARVENRLF